MSMSAPPQRDALEARIHELIPRLTPPPPTRGRPEVLSSALLWTAVLVGIVRGQGTQQAVWRLLSQTGLWAAPRTPVSAEAIRIRLQRTGPTVMAELFDAVSATVHPTIPEDRTLAPFAAGVYALDACTLDQVARTTAELRDVPAGDDRLLPGKLNTAFDVRRQQFTTVQPTPSPRQNERRAARDLLATVPSGSLILADLGYFGFPWFDELTDDGFHFVSKLRDRTSYEVVHTMWEGGDLVDQLIWLGAYRADQAKHLYRLVQVRHGRGWTRYLTNVRDAGQFPASDVGRLYARRWDVELAFKTLKRDLGLHLLWSARWELLLTQVWGALIIAQLAAAMRQQVAARAQVDLFDVSLSLLLRDLPYLARQHGSAMIALLASLPVAKGGYLRPARRVRRCVTVPNGPPALLPVGTQLTRTPRYAGRRCGPNRTNRPPSR